MRRTQQFALYLLNRIWQVYSRPIAGTHRFSRYKSYLLLSNVNWFIKDDPDGGLPASWMRGRTLVGHELLNGRQEAPQREVLDWRGLA